jgi:hypothetical protein
MGAEGGGFASDDIPPNDTVGYPWMGDQWYDDCATCTDEAHWRVTSVE